MTKLQTIEKGMEIIGNETGARKAIMTVAWNIAKQGAKVHGGKASEYFAQALKMTWKAMYDKFAPVVKEHEFKVARFEEQQAPVVEKEEVEDETVEVETSYGSRRNKSWVAKVTVVNGKINREFVNATGEHDKGFGGLVFTLAPGIYEVCDGGDRDFVEVINGEMNYIEYANVMSAA